MTTEQHWINQLQARWPQSDFGHDTAFNPATRQILTVDMLVENVHFDWAYFQPFDVGWRAMAANLSDIAATGGVPEQAFISIGVPGHNSLNLLEAIYTGIEACCKAYHVNIAGGDTVQSPHTVISITLTGTLPEKATPGRRHGAAPGDLVIATGFHGLSAVGLLAFQKGLTGFEEAKQAHLHPVPRIKTGQRIARSLPRFAMMDSSDGLADAAMRLSQGSRVNVVLQAQQLALHPEVTAVAAQGSQDPLDFVLYGGEDFELVAAIPPEALRLFPEAHPIGTVHPAETAQSPKAFLQQADGSLTALSTTAVFQHFHNPAVASS